MRTPIADTIRSVDMIENVAPVARAALGWQTKLLVFLAVFAGYTSFVAVTANKLTRNHYKAGQVDRLEQEVLLFQRAAALAGQFANRERTLRLETEQKIEGLVTEFAKAEEDRDPVVIEKWRTEYVDAPQTYADEDPARCLAYIYPDGMQQRAEADILTALSALPGFDRDGVRTLPAPGGGEAIAEGVIDYTGLWSLPRAGEGVQRAPGAEGAAGRGGPRTRD